MYEAETGFYYLGSRYYDPETGRFLNADGLISTGVGVLGFNMFAYCNNNPILFSDSNGTRPVVGDSIEDEADKSFEYMKALHYYNEVAQTQVLLQSLGFSDSTYNSAQDCLATLKTSGIDTNIELAHFFSQCYVESLGSILEAGYLSEEVAEAYRKGQPYYPYYGAGYIQLTWDYNYAAFAEYMNDPEIYNIGPKYVAQNYAWSAAGWFWTNNRINSAIANGASVRDVTRIVNGGYNHLDLREQSYYRFIGILGG